MMLLHGLLPYQTTKNKPIVTYRLIISSYQASFSTNFMAKSKSQALKDTSVTVVVIGNSALFLVD